MRSGRSGPWIIVAAAVALTLATAACRTVDRVERAEPRATPNYVDTARVATAGGLHHDVNVVALRETTVAGGLIKVEAELENRRWGTLNFLYGFEWFDHQGMSIRQPQWRSATIQGQQRLTISDVAASPEAVDFRLHLKRGR